MSELQASTLYSRVIDVAVLPANVCVLLSAMPAASTTAMLAEKYDGNSAFASRLVFVSTLGSMISLPIITWLFQMFQDIARCGIFFYTWYNEEHKEV